MPNVGIEPGMIPLDNSTHFITTQPKELRGRLRALLNVIALGESSQASEETKTAVYESLIVVLDIPQNVLVGLKWALERDAGANRRRGS